MRLFERTTSWFNVPTLTRKRIWFAFIVAVITDALQLLLGPLGWVFVDEGLDMVAMLLTTWALGFHMLLLPTFIIEFIPVADMLPTWTGCVAAVVMLRRKVQASPAAPPHIDVSSTVVPAPPKQLNREQPDSLNR